MMGCNHYYTVITYLITFIIINIFFQLKKRIDKVEGTSTELERQQKLSKDNLDRARKEEATPEERSRVQVRKIQSSNHPVYFSSVYFHFKKKNE